MSNNKTRQGDHYRTTPKEELADCSCYQNGVQSQGGIAIPGIYIIFSQEKDVSTHFDSKASATIQELVVIES
jgi:hypothetical protein